MTRDVMPRTILLRGELKVACGARSSSAGSAHTVFGNLKTWLRGTSYGVSPKHLQRTLDELVFRFDRRWRGALLRAYAHGS